MKSLGQKCDRITDLIDKALADRPATDYERIEAERDAVAKLMSTGTSAVR